MDTCYALITEHLSVPLTEENPPAVVSSSILYLSGCPAPGLADSLLFSHLVEVATSKTDPRGLARIQKEFPVLYVYFIHLCEEFFHVKSDSDTSAGVLLQSNNATLYQSLLTTHSMGTTEAPSAVADFVQLVFGKGAVPVSCPLVCSQDQQAVIVPYVNEPCQIHPVKLWKSTNYDLGLSMFQKMSRLVSSSSSTSTSYIPTTTALAVSDTRSTHVYDKKVNALSAMPTIDYVGFRCLLFSTFVVGSFVKSAFDIVPLNR